MHSHAWQAQSTCVVPSNLARVRAVQVPSPVALVVGGAWRGHLAGGRLPQPSWPSNPQFMLSSQQRAEVMVTLTRVGRRSDRGGDGSSEGAAEGAVEGMAEHDAREAIGMAVVEVRCTGS
jgi:hypothetical protein